MSGYFFGLMDAENRMSPILALANSLASLPQTVFVLIRIGLILQHKIAQRSSHSIDLCCVCGEVVLAEIVPWVIY